jgi:hypothetical protein
LASGPDSGTPKGFRGGLGATEVHREAEVPVPIRPGLAAPERGRDVAPGQCALALGVLRGHRGESARAGSGPGRLRVPTGEYLGMAGHGEVLVHHEPALLSVQPRSATNGSGRTPTHQISERVGTVDPLVSRTEPRAASAIEVHVQTSTPRRRSTRSGSCQVQ